MTEIVPGSRFYGRWFLPIGRVVTWPLFQLLGPVFVTGRERVPRTGGLLIVANHIADCDPPFVQFACPRAMHYMAKRELFDIRGLGWLIRRLNAFPVERDRADRGSLRLATELLKAGEAVTIFPEGRIAEDGRLQPLKPGVALLARQTNVATLCVGLRGTQHVLPYGKIIPRPSFRGVHIAWGEPRTFARDEDNDTVMAWIESELRRLTGQETTP